ncbi:hypothetical protein DD721_07595 [Bifidobacterium longum]|nr:hypothetical protein DD678_07665 [Bifidobacterium longum]PVV44886.1 hypothetical protein DD701_10435 [Bifidobacterium longum]PVV55751.1 hypothetical protein DD705_10580 [Bifidobacterium longum]PVV57956.1 hypothetical protein DD721_07595 [Bifidobacterium longum]
MGTGRPAPAPPPDRGTRARLRKPPADRTPPDRGTARGERNAYPDPAWEDGLDILPRMNAGDSRISRFGFLFDTTTQEGRGR